MKKEIRKLCVSSKIVLTCTIKFKKHYRDFYLSKKLFTEIILKMVFGLDPFWPNQQKGN